MPLRIGVIGAGHLGKIHAKLAASQDDMQLVGVADPISDAAARVATEFNCKVHTDYRDMIGDIDAAIVAAPTCHHFEIGRELLRRGVHVLMEKPITPTTEEADSLVNLARLQKVVLQVGHIERFSPAFTAVRSAVTQPRFIQAARCNGYTFRSTDISVVMDLMVHDIDLAIQLAGSAVQSVEAIGMTIFGPHEDLAHARLTFDNGCVAVLQASRVSDVPQRSMEIWTDQTRCRVDFANRTATIAKTASSIYRGEWDVSQLTRNEQENLKSRVFEDLIQLEHREAAAVNPIVEEQRDFLEAIREGRDPQVTGEHGRDTVAVAERILRQIRTQRDRFSQTPDLAENQNANILRGPHWHQNTPNRSQDNRKSA